LQEAFAEIDQQGLQALHYLKLAQEPRPVEEFCPFFYEEPRSYYNDEAIKQTFMAIKERLLTRGVALVHLEGSFWDRGKKWGRYKVYLPVEFANLLPPLKLPTIPIEGKVAFASSSIREILLKGLLGTPSGFSFKGITFPKVHLSERAIRLEGKLYPTVEEIHQALLEKWFLCEIAEKKLRFVPSRDNSLRAKARKYFLQCIPANYGLKKEDLAKVAEQFYVGFKENELDVFIEAGLALGFLGKKMQVGTEYLIPRLEVPQELSTPLTMQEEKGKVRLSLNPNFSLEELT
jgi:hypothetical protein